MSLPRHRRPHPRASLGGAGALLTAALAIAATGACNDVTVSVLMPVPSASAAVSCGPPVSVVCEGQLGDECKDWKDCCSGTCLTAEDGKKRCGRAAPCGSYCELCSVDTDCCSGRCADDGTGTGTWRCHTGECRVQGELCGGDADCCQGAGPGRCVEDPVGLKAKRCRLDSSGPPCIADGVRCALAAECCGGYCIGGGKPEPTCASACVPNEAPCTTAADCCTPEARCEATVDEPICHVAIR